LAALAVRPHPNSSVGRFEPFAVGDVDPVDGLGEAQVGIDV